MSRLVRFGRSQVARLHGLTSRQGLALITIGVLCLGVAVASAAGQDAVAMTLLAGLLGAVLVGLLYVALRLGGLYRAHRVGMRDLRVLVEETQRRVVATLESERVAAATRHRDLTARLARDDRDVQEVTRLLLREQSAEAEAAYQVHRQVTPRAPMPFSADTGGSAADLLGLLHLVRTRRPAMAVTLGAGSAAVWLAYAVEAAGGHLVAVEHDRDTAEQVRALAAAHGMAQVAEVIHAPLSDSRPGSDTAGWYEWTALSELRDVDLLVVDGPAEMSAPRRVGAALRVFGPRLTGDAVVVVDDGPGAREANAGLGKPLPEPVVGRFTALAYVPPPAATVTAAAPS
ncbi:class I SAM-dependent methyltransferase [Krasilnikovia sp. MM14-A1259]|uniref:class I SAM-dependent methyltransferase n=1 Tax=Krasilnikovia sp. MM14-A1259 TaxID=3373539 RepID=UPI0038045AA2